jgi:uncharacterized membrane protein
LRAIDTLVLARLVHVAAVMHWIGGVWFVTAVVLPSIRRGHVAAERLAAFDRVERGFAAQARVSTLLAGLSGLYMTESLGAWPRFLDAGYWWMHAMVALWLIFTLMLFVAEPLFLHQLLHARAARDPEGTFALVERLHSVLSVLALLTVLGAVGGSHGAGIFGLRG